MWRYVTVTIDQLHLEDRAPCGNGRWCCLYATFDFRPNRHCNLLLEGVKEETI